MRIVHVTSGAQAGVHHATSLYAKEQRALGHEIAIVHLVRGKEAHNTVYEESGIRHITLTVPQSSVQLGSAPAQFFRSNSAGDDLYHFHSAFIPVHALAARLLPIPYVVSPHGGYSQWWERHPWRKRLFRILLDRRFLGRAAALHALTEAEATAIERYRPGAPITIVPNGIPPDEPPGPEERAAARASLGIRADQLAIVFIGRRDIRMKGLDLLLDGTALAQPTIQRPLRLLIAGPPRAGEPPLESLIPSAIADAVSVLPPVEGAAKRQLLAAADLFASPSRWEGMPLAPMEALTLGVPVVGTEATGQQDFLRAESAGETVPTTPEGVAEGLRQAAARIPTDEGARRTERDRISLAARAAFPPQRTAEGLITLYRSALDG